MNLARFTTTCPMCNAGIEVLWISPMPNDEQGETTACIVHFPPECPLALNLEVLRQLDADPYLPATSSAIRELVQVAE